MNELERRLQELGGEIAYPATPSFDLGFERRPARMRLRPLALGFAILLAVGRRRARVLARRPQRLPRDLPHPRRDRRARRTLPDVPAQRIDFGERVSRDEAERRVGFELLDLGSEPDAIFVRPDGLASVVYGDPRSRGSCSLRPAARSTRASSRRRPSRARPSTRSPSTASPASSSTGQHFVMFLDENGSISDERTYLAGTVLLWNRGELLLRLEGDLTEEEALELAESVE